MSASCILAKCDARSYPRKVARMIRHAGLAHVARLPKLFSHIVTISDLQESVVMPLMPNGTVFHRVDNPIAVAQAPVHEGPPGDFLFVGRISTEKGAPIFAEAARRAGVRALFVGDGSERADLAARYPEAVMLGWRDPAAVQALMRQARALVFPSVWYEGQPLTVYEALAAPAGKRWSTARPGSGSDQAIPMRWPPICAAYRTTPSRPGWAGRRMGATGPRR
jgi:glycosyltransferase involved in cell wall biosynthesis